MDCPAAALASTAAASARTCVGQLAALTCNAIYIYGVGGLHGSARRRLTPLAGAHLIGCQFGTRFIYSNTDNGADDTQVLPEAG